MSKADIRGVDSAELRTRVMESVRTLGKLDRDRLRRILAADRAESYRAAGYPSTVEMLVDLLDVSKRTASLWIQTAQAIERLPLISSALESGSLSLDKTIELARFATPETEQKLVPWAQRSTVEGVRHRALLALKPTKRRRSKR